MLRVTMTTVHRKRLLSIGTFGTLLTLLVLVADSADRLAPVERQLYDARATYFQFFSPPPTDKLVHVDIDDGALAQVGPWPWSRSLMADVIEEMQSCGAKVIVLDILFSEAKEPEVIEVRPGAYQRIDHDARLEEAVAKAGNVLVASSLSFAAAPTRDAAEQAVFNALVADLELSVTDAVARAQQASGAGSSDPALPRRIAARFAALRGEAIRQRINEAIGSSRPGRVAPATSPAAAAVDVDGLKRTLLPRLSERGGQSPVARQLEEEYKRVRAIRALRRFAMPAGQNLPPLITAREGMLPIPGLGETAAFGGFVDYLPESDGVVRCIPLAVWYGDQLLPQIGLAAACAAMDVDMRKVRITPTDVIIPRPAGDEIHIPIRAYSSGRYKGMGGFLDIPLFGSKTRDVGGWEWMYDYPNHREPKARMSIVDVVAPCQTHDRIRRNDQIARELLVRALQMSESDAEAFAAQPPEGGELLRQVNEAMDTIVFQTETLSKLTDPSEAERRQLAALRRDLRGLENWRSQHEALAKQLESEHARLKAKLRDRIVFVGSISTGAYDFVATSLDARCPGVYLHSATFNAIMTQDVWRIAPRWITLVIAGFMGLLMTVCVATLSPPKAFAAVIFVAGAFITINGLWLFDRHNLIVGAAAPLLTVVVVWSGLTLIQFIREISERARLTKRFSSYVDPTLVNYVIENPEQARLEAHQQELTVVFTDLQGFTTLAETLGPQSAQMLGKYMETMVPLIRARHGYVNKFLGDGIMFFFGAPIDNPEHASDAVAVVLDMQAALGPFNQKLAQQKLPTLAMRSGVSTGLMVVGDAGPSFASDYTVLGDVVNLAARLEGANKAFGTSNLITARTAELIKEKFVTRPIANLLVVGKRASAMVHEAVAPLDKATEEQKRLAALTTEMFDAFAAQRFDDCARLIEEMERLGGASKLTTRYAEEVAARRGQPHDPEFKGQIQLFVK
jgi:class 3 adenylate cyclase/CHASE2 domain-containing sensor protein